MPGDMAFQSGIVPFQEALVFPSIIISENIAASYFAVWADIAAILFGNAIRPDKAGFGTACILIKTSGRDGLAQNIHPDSRRYRCFFPGYLFQTTIRAIHMAQYAKRAFSSSPQIA